MMLTSAAAFSRRPWIGDCPACQWTGCWRSEYGCIIGTLMFCKKCPRDDKSARDVLDKGT